MEESAERSQALKSHLETNVRHAQFVRAQELLGFLDSSFDQILMRRFVKCLPKQTEEVITGKTGVTGNLLEIERQVVALIDKLLRSIEALKNFRSVRGCRITDYGRFVHRGISRFSGLIS